MKFIRHIKAY